MMKNAGRQGLTGLVLTLAVGILAATLSGTGCGLFEPRTPELSNNSGQSWEPPTDPSIVLTNLQRAITAKNLENYLRSLNDSSKTHQGFVFAPAAVPVQYASLLSNWTIDDERTYFQNLLAKTGDGFSDLQLTRKDSTLSSDAPVYSCSYVLTFDHTEAGFPTSASGDLQFTLIRDNSNFWYIARWVDIKTDNDITWSYFKAKFSN